MRRGTILESFSNEAENPAPNTPQSALSKTRQQLQEYLETLQVTIRERLMNNEDENLLCKHTSTSTNLKQYQAIAKDLGPEAFVTNVFP